MISEHQRESFARRGLIRLDQRIPEETVAPARRAVLEILERQGVWRDGTWLGDESVGDGRLATRILRALKPRIRSAEFRNFVTDDILESARRLAGGRTVLPWTKQPQVLFTPPNAETWTVPHNVWHLDFPRLGALGLPGVQMFSFLDEVAPGAGGTLVVAGSHRLLNDDGKISSKHVKRRLQREPYFRGLFKGGEGDRQHFVDEIGHLGDVELQVVELHGEPGDVFLMDMRLLHTLAPNATRRPRLMVTQRFPLEAILEAMQNRRGSAARRAPS